jgi:hypothetical protein
MKRQKISAIESITLEIYYCPFSRIKKVGMQLGIIKVLKLLSPRSVKDMYEGFGVCFALFCLFKWI